MSTVLLAAVIVFLAGLTGLLSWRLYVIERGHPGVVVAVHVISDPPGATLASMSGADVLGTAPFTMQYAVPAQWTKCVSYDGLQARWPNGVALEVKTLELCPDGGTDQEVRLSAPRPSVAPRAPKNSSRQHSHLSIPAVQPADPLPPAERRASNPPVPVPPLPTPPPTGPSRSSTDPPSSPPAPSVVLTVATTRTVRSGSRVPVEVVARQSSESGYSFVVPGYVSSRANAYANCSGTEHGSLDATTYGSTTYGNYRGTTYANCSGSSTTTTTFAPSREVSYAVSGATLSLRLPDGRVAVVNCDSKVNWTEWTFLPRRSCRVPTTDSFEAEFRAEKAKLFWRVGVSGEKERSETYRLLEIVNRAP
jgi:hypothetical protein